MMEPIFQILPDFNMIEAQAQPPIIQAAHVGPALEAQPNNELVLQ